MDAQLDLMTSDVRRSPRNGDYFQQRDEAMRAILDFAGKRFHERAKEFVVGYLRAHGATSGEIITDRCREAGIAPPGTDDRAFGPVFYSLSRAGKIVKVASCQRRKGHGTNGGIVWAIPT